MSELLNILLKNKSELKNVAVVLKKYAKYLILAAVAMAIIGVVALVLIVMLIWNLLIQPLLSNGPALVENGRQTIQQLQPAEVSLPSVDTILQGQQLLENPEGVAGELLYEQVEQSLSPEAQQQLNSLEQAIQDTQQIQRQIEGGGE